MYIYISSPLETKEKKKELVTFGLFFFVFCFYVPIIIFIVTFFFFCGWIYCFFLFVFRIELFNLLKGLNPDFFFLPFLSFAFIFGGSQSKYFSVGKPKRKNKNKTKQKRKERTCGDTTPKGIIKRPNKLYKKIQAAFFFCCLGLW